MMIMWKFLNVFGALIIFPLQASSKPSSQPCLWDSKAGAKFDLRPLMLTDKSANTNPYQIVDGDIPCTPETEPSYGYAWNFCANVPSSMVPEPCNLMGKNAVVLQFAKYSQSEYYCYIIGHYDSQQHELKYSLLDPHDPSKGVSIAYPSGEKCSSTNTVTRSATIDVQCANVKSVVAHAEEPTICNYHLVMKSYYGCPTDCAITSNGLCDSHGHCAFDPKAQKSYCYCNAGYYGNACNSRDSGAAEPYDGFSVQLGLLITLLIVALGLTGGMVYLSLRIAEFRKQQVSNNYRSLPGAESELVETVSFR